MSHFTDIGRIEISFQDGYIGWNYTIETHYTAGYPRQIIARKYGLASFDVAYSMVKEEVEKWNGMTKRDRRKVLIK